MTIVFQSLAIIKRSVRCFASNNLENLGYWIVTTIASGYIAQYSLIDNQLIDNHFVGDAPAILTIDSENQKIY